MKKKFTVFPNGLLRRNLQLAMLFLPLGMGHLFAQDYVHQVLFLNEGHYDYTNSVQTVPVTLGSYVPSTQTYSVVATIPNARFASDVIIDGQSIYVAADSFLLRYDINTYQQTGYKVIHGIRKLALWNNHLLVSRGDVVNLKSYFQVYDKTALSFIYELDTLNGPKYASQGIAVYKDSAYLAVNNSFSWGNEKGLLGIIDLKNKLYAAEINLGVDGKNPDNVMCKGNMIYTLNNKDFSSSSVSSYNAVNRTSSTANVAISSGCGASVLASDYVYYQEYALNKLARFDVNTQTVFDTLGGSVSYYGLLDDTINHIIYGTSTDFTSSGNAYVMQYNGTVLSTFAVGVSAGNMALDVRSATAVTEQSSLQSISFYPNPAVSELNVQLAGKAVHAITIYNNLGDAVYTETVSGSGSHKISVAELAPGIYYLKINTESGTASSKFIKQ